MQQLPTGFVPLLSSQAGSCLTMKNWQAANVTTVAFNLADLLMKPGLAVLNLLTSIHHYCGWSGPLILNGMSLLPNREDIYTVRSTYDGGVVRINVETLFALISQLKPNLIILPPGSARHFQQFWQHLPADIIPYFSHQDDLSMVTGESGQYVDAESFDSMNDLLQLANTIETPLYIKNNHDILQFKSLLKRENCLIESNSPAQDAMTGFLYSKSGRINILNSAMREAHHIIDSECQCKTCSQQLTCAYLHHLLQHTPLLAQRFLIQHNVFFLKKSALTAN